MENYIHLLGPAIITFLVSLVLTKVIIVVSHKRGLMAKPTEDRWHKTPTPIFGGVAIFIAFAVSMMIFHHDTFSDLRIVGLLIGGTLMFAMGLLDDIVNLRPNVKLMFQIFGAVIVLGSGVYFKMFSPILMIPLSVLWIIGITNAFNLLDNMDGLSAGIASIACLNIFFFDFIGGKGAVYFPSIILMSAMLGFLVFNFNPAKIFMGDSGALFIGFTIASITIIGSNTDVSNLAFTILFPLLMMAVPIFDTTLVTVLRRGAGRKVSEGGKDHSSHRLVKLGLSERNTVLLLYIISLLSGGLILAFSLMSEAVLIVIAILLIIMLWQFGRFLAQAQVYPRLRSQMSSLSKRAIASVLINRLPSTQMITDFLLVGVSLTIGYLLKFDGNIPEHDRELLVYSIPILIPIKLACLYYFGVYKQMWRYITFRDLLEIVKAVSLGSILSIIVILFFQRFYGFSRTVYIIDWVVFLFLIVSARLTIRLMRDLFVRIHKDESQIIIYGAGDAGNLLLEEMYNNEEFPYQPMAFFDDDRKKRGRTIQGLPIIGGIAKLKEFAKKNDADKIIIAIPSITDDNLQHVYQTCRDAGLQVFRFIPAQVFLVEGKSADKTSPRLGEEEAAAEH